MRSPGLSLFQLDHYGKRMRAFLEMLAVMVVLFIALLLFASPSHAATNLTSSVTSANGELTTVLTWESTQSQCVASGHPDWSGPKPASGTLELPTISLSGTYPLVLDCSTPANKTARLTWRNPTHNTDGTTLTNLASILIHYGRSADALAQTVNLTPPATTYTLEDLALGDWFFAVRAVNSAGAESVLSNVVRKTITEGTTEHETVTLTVNPIPNAVTDLQVE